MNRCWSVNLKYNPVIDVIIFLGLQDASSDLNSIRDSDLFYFIVDWS